MVYPKLELVCLCVHGHMINEKINPKILMTYYTQYISSILKFALNFLLSGQNTFKYNKKIHKE